jgi:hypothetical protein
MTIAGKWSKDKIIPGKRPVSTNRVIAIDLEASQLLSYLMI